MQIDNTPSIDEIVDCFDRVEELEEMSVIELCDELDIPYKPKQRFFKNNIISDIIIKEYGHEILPYFLLADTRMAQLLKEIPDYPHPLIDVLLYEVSPISIH